MLQAAFPDALGAVAELEFDTEEAAPSGYDAFADLVQMAVREDPSLASVPTTSGMLLCCSCPSALDHLSLTICIAQPLLPICPDSFALAHLPLPFCPCPSAIAHLSLPVCFCPSASCPSALPHLSALHCACLNHSSSIGSLKPS